MNAYDLRPFQISGAGLARYGSLRHYRESEVMTPRKTTRQNDRHTAQSVPAQMQLRLQTLLADRFQLKVHKETKDFQSTR